jgi:hypothetical protein
MSGSILLTGNVSAIPIGNLPFGTDGYDSGVPRKTKTEDRSPAVVAYEAALTARRRARLITIIEDIGSQVLAVEKLGKPQSLLSRLALDPSNRNSKPIGEALAREIEHAAGKPFGWLDEDRERKITTNDLSQDAWGKELLELWPKLSESDHRALCERAAGFLQPRQNREARSRRSA